jgi:hypothetical protein
MLDVAESVEVDADSNVDVDLDGDVEIQHSTAQHSIAHYSTIVYRPSLESVTHSSQQTDGLVEEDQAGAGLGWRCGDARRQQGRQAVHQSVG